MKLLFMFLCFASLGLNGCTYTMAVSQSNIPATRTKPVQASIEKFMILGLNFDNDYAMQLTHKLKERCPQGDVRGVTTQDKVTLYLLYFFWQREISAQGYCLPHKSTASIEPEFGDVAYSQE